MSRKKPGMIAGSLKLAVEQQGVNPETVLDRTFLSSMTLKQNRARGEVHEKIVMMALMKAFGLTDLALQVRFETPMGFRFYDVYHAQDRVCFEVKSGRCNLSKFVRKQIEKDKFLVQSKQVGGVIWCLFEGGSRPLLRALETAGLQILVMDNPA